MMINDNINSFMENKSVFDKLDVLRIGNVLELSQYKIAELKEKGTCSFASSDFYNKGLYQVKNEKSKSIMPFAVNIDKVAAATYAGLVEELGEDCVDKQLWANVPEGDVIFFYSLHREDEFVTSKEKKDYMVV